jgi:MFS family permease
VTEFREGLATVIAAPFLWISILVFAFINVTDAGPRNIALPFLIHDHLGLEVAALGLVTSAFSLGSVLGAVILGRSRRLRRRGPLAYGAVGLCGLMIVGYGLAPNLGVLAGLATIYGMSFATGGLVWTNTLQAMVPPERLGRVSSIDALGSFVLMPVGFALAGALTDALGPARVFLIGGGATACLALLALLHPAIRRLD